MKDRNRITSARPVRTAAMVVWVVAAGWLSGCGQSEPVAEAYLSPVSRTTPAAVESPSNQQPITRIQLEPTPETPPPSETVARQPGHLVDRIDQTSDAVQDRIDQVADTVDRQAADLDRSVDQVRHDINQAADRARGELDRIENRANQAVDRFEDKTSEAVDRATGRIDQISRQAAESVDRTAGKVKQRANKIGVALESLGQTLQEPAPPATTP